MHEITLIRVISFLLISDAIAVILFLVIVSLWLRLILTFRFRVEELIDREACTKHRNR